MVRVHVGDVDLIDLLRLVACGFQVGQQIAQSRAKQRGRAGVDQHQFRAGVDQVAVDGGFQRRGDKRLVQRFFDPGRRGVGQKFVDRQADRTV